MYCIKLNLNRKGGHGGMDLAVIQREGEMGFLILPFYASF